MAHRIFDTFPRELDQDAPWAELTMHTQAYHPTATERQLYTTYMTNKDLCD